MTSEIFASNFLNVEARSRKLISKIPLFYVSYGEYEKQKNRMQRYFDDVPEAPGFFFPSSRALFFECSAYFTRI